MSGEPAGIDHRAIPLIARSDVSVQKILFRDEAYHVVKDPLALKYFHLQPSQHAVWEHLDGRRTTEQIRNILTNRFPTISIRSSDVQRLAIDLHRNGLTSSLRKGQSIRLDRRRRQTARSKVLQAVSNPFFIKFPAVNPSSLVDRCDWIASALFSKLAIFAGGLLIIASWVEAMIRFDALRENLPTLTAFFGWPNLLWLWLMISLTKVIHEFGHAIACRRIGCRCHGIGIALLVFSPTLYCDATDSWMCPRKWARIGVASAGMYVEVLLGAVAIFVWSHTYSGLLNSLALNVAAISTVSTVLFNANPLIRFDGYYILSDFVEIPNLQEKSSRVLYRTSLWLLGWTTDPNPLDPKSGRIWFLSYAVLSAAYRWFIMFAILFTIYSIVRPYRVESVAGVWITVVGLMTGIGFIRSWSNAAKGKTDMPVVKKRLAVTLGFLAVLIASILSVPVPWWRHADFEVSVSNPHSVVAVAGGLITNIYVKPGDYINSGQLILELENEVVEDEIRDLQLQKVLLESEAETLNLANKHADWIVKKQELRRVSQRLDELMPVQEGLRVQSPVNGRVIPPRSRHRRDDDQGSSLSGWHGLALDAENVGAVLEAGAEIAQIEPGTSRYAEIYVDQHDRMDLSLGQEVCLKADSFPAEEFVSAISSISSDRTDEIPRALSQRLGGRVPTTMTMSGVEQVESRRYRVIVSLPDDSQILPGMRGQARFQLERRTVGQWLSRLVKSTFFFRM